MGRAKDIILKVIPSKTANEFVKKHHYSGKVVQNSSLHFGAFLGGKLHGVMQYGSPLDKRKVLPLVTGTLWNEMLELNRMAFDEHLPKNSESRCLAISFRLIRKNAPQIKWVLSFSDGTQCGDGAIYRASGFVLTSIKKNNQIWEAPGQSDARESRIALTDNRSFGEQEKARKTLSRVSATKGSNITHTFALRVHGEQSFTNGAASMKAYIAAGFKPLEGYQLRYIYFLHPEEKQNLNAPIIPFTDIDKIGAGMYLGQKITLAERRQTSVQSIDGDVPDNQSGEGGSIPT